MSESVIFEEESDIRPSQILSKSRKPPISFIKFLVAMRLAKTQKEAETFLLIVTIAAILAAIGIFAYMFFHSAPPIPASVRLIPLGEHH